MIELNNRLTPIELSTQKDDKYKRNRLETRRLELYHTKELSYFHSSLTGFAVVKRTVIHKKPRSNTTRTTEETAYFTVLSFISVKELNTIIRSHWKIKNKNHYVRDVTLGEDASNIKKYAFAMCIFKSLALNLMRLGKVINVAKEIQINQLDFGGMLIRYGGRSE